MLLLANKKAKLEYQILETYQAGIVLLGSEVKSLRAKRGSFSDSYVKIVGQELFLINAQINPYKFADNRQYDPTRNRKLLIKKKEILALQSQLNKKNVTLVPLSFETAHNHIKLIFALAKGKKEYEKRADLKKKALQRDIEREVKDKVRLR